MSKEDMVKEAVEEAKAKAAMETEASQTETEVEDETVEEVKSEETLEEADEEKEAESIGKKKFGRKNKKDPKDEKIAELNDKITRQMAEFDNFRKRTAEQAADNRLRATEKLMGDVLPVLDDFERAIAHAEANGEQGLLDGVKAISSKLGDVLSKHGLVTIDPQGEPFDALQHQAVATVEDVTVFDETVSQVYQKGYSLGVKVIRPAMVVIANGGPKREEPKNDSEAE